MRIPGRRGVNPGGGEHQILPSPALAGRWQQGGEDIKVRMLLGRQNMSLHHRDTEYGRMLFSSAPICVPYHTRSCEHSKDSFGAA